MKRYQICWLIVAASCNPYFNHEGEFIAGAADPVNYPPAYLGAGGDRLRPGRGTFTEVRAYAGGNQIGYFSFPFSTSQVGPPAPPAGFNPLRIISSGAPVTRVPTPTAYRFDPATPCTPPPGYVYDPRLDEVRYDEQGNITTALPSATYAAGAAPSWSYVPIVAETTVSGTVGCQDIKSSATLQKRTDLTLTPTGNYLAWAIIDVAAAVYRLGEVPGQSPGILTQRFGWFDQFIIAYIDGGAVPTISPDNGQSLDMVPQALFIPTRITTATGTQANGALGQGYDVLEATRGQVGYSPVCEVFTYDTSASPPTVANLPRDAATIRATYPPSAIRPATTRYIYCLQVQ